MAAVKRLARLPVLRVAARRYARRRAARFPGSATYWQQRYEAGGTSGPGSYDRLAEYKASFLNSLVAGERIRSVIEHGCGDGNQLLLASYPEYLGFDISEQALERCRRRFSADATKRFEHSANYAGETADLALSLDVLYHLVEDVVFADYMRLLFDSAERFVVVYSSDTDQQSDLQAPHVRHRTFTRWVEEHRPDWILIDNPPNPLDDAVSGGSFARFFVYGRRIEA